MNMTIGIVKDVDACGGIAASWTRGAAGRPEVIVSPPASLDDLGRRSSLIVLAGPDDGLPETVAALRPVVGPGAVIISTSPVVSLEVLRSLAGAEPALFRAIIPLGTEPGEGAAALAPEAGTPRETVERVKAALAWIGGVELVSEDALDAVAALVLGGASFLAEALQGMEEGAVRDGLPRETARAFAHQTALATALLLRDHSGSPADLKDQVASPGGTTIAGLASLEDAGVRGAYIRAVERTAVEVRKRRHAARSSVIE
jgi:pyrroline-5-carboxylate reductase